MKAEFFSKISSYIFIVLMVVTLVVLGLFYCVGYDNQSAVTGGAYVTDPQYTDLLLYWMYALMVIGIVCVVIFGIIQFAANMVTNPMGSIKSILVLVAMGALIGVSYALSSDESILINGTAFDDSAILKMTDVCIYVQYVLLVISVIVAVLSPVVKLFFNKIKA